tara:strand:- start:364 stop:867 length:504 start_codon:yes stop_codon:yes gene_type:complete
MTYEITHALLDLKWPNTYTRKNILNEGDKCYEGFALGYVWSWAHKKTAEEPGACLRLSQTTRDPKFREIYQLSKFLGEEFGAEFSTIQFNRNYQCNKHIDGNNAGISHIIGLGNYEGGELLIYYDGPDQPPTAVDIKNRFYSFDGSTYYHETAPFTGDRITLVYFSL